MDYAIGDLLCMLGQAGRPTIDGGSSGVKAKALVLCHGPKKQGLERLRWLELSKRYLVLNSGYQYDPDCLRGGARAAAARKSPRLSAEGSLSALARRSLQSRSLRVGL